MKKQSQPRDTVDLPEHTGLIYQHFKDGWKLISYRCLRCSAIFHGKNILRKHMDKHGEDDAST